MIYAHNPHSAKPEPPIVMGRVPKIVEEAVAINDKNRPMYISTECVKTRNERPWKINATTVIAMPTENIFTDLNEPKFSLLIMHKSSNALLTELIPRWLFVLK